MRSENIEARRCLPCWYLLSDCSLNYANAFAEPELFRVYDPNKKVFHQEAELIHDLEPMEMSDYIRGFTATG